MDQCSKYDNMCSVIKAANFAAIKHRKQKRKDIEETPYINHPIGVANILTSEGGICDPVVLQAALLHDTVEDTATTLEEIEEHFGAAVRNIVAEVTDDKSLPYGIRKQMQIEKAKKCSYEAKLVKLADKLYNLRDLQKSTPIGWTNRRVEEYFLWAAEVVKNLQGTHSKLEDELKHVFSAQGIYLNN
ncbi:guanosine-3',5'-bis(diphosphate) 3'-pyrophosphohydrolase MESH1-like isoform X2 [Stegodyphus dumicola]|uniref:guanosine-3',5'-bis(diphosphate) 3'-pyrophosphohydrolase MESH1-like isoform X2 n=1 Tax=Stegodyphus dumicola TaxID=202533 RepID=UPI0015A7C4B3|nr:guanosine-3',5'-bis(diphosphate) 3'-pyrophosphohydrolase MESH1-like isoform X2 [Stegodyphus dumicola]